MFDIFQTRAGAGGDRGVLRGGPNSVKTPSYLADVCISVSLVVGMVAVAGHSSCHAPELRSVGETLLCRARPHGTTSTSNCGLHRCLVRRLRKKNSKIIYSAATALLKTFVKLAL